jgi:hypothetical protein
MIVLWGLWWPGRHRVLITMIALPLLLPVWLGVVVQSLCRVVWEIIRIVRLRRLGHLLTLEAEVKGVDFLLYRSTLTHVWLRFGRFQLTRGSLISWLRLGRLRRTVQMHVVQMFVDGRLTLVRGSFVKVWHGSFYLILPVHSPRRFLIVIIVDASQAFVLLRMVVPRLLRMSKIVLIG